MTPEQATRLTDIVARVVRGESGASRELMDESRKWAVWMMRSPERAELLSTLGGIRVDLMAGPRGKVRMAWAEEADRIDLVGLPLDEAKARVTAEFEARGYVVLP